MQDKADSKLIKRLNEVRLLNLIRTQGPISRNELARRSKISKVAVSEIIGRLMEAGYVLEIGKGKSTQKGGKRPTMIKLNPENGYVIGIEIKRRFARIALANMVSEILGVDQVNYDVGTTIDDGLQKIFDRVDGLLAKHQIERCKLISIAIGIPGFIDYSKGELLFADTLRGWANQPLAIRFKERYGVPTILENDVNIIALGEALSGAGVGTSNLVCIWIGEGIGSGIMVDEHLVRGETGNAGEIGYLELGHYVTNMNRLKNLYTSQRYFGELLSEMNLFETLKMKLQWRTNHGPESNEHQTLEAMLAEGDRGNVMVQEILDEYALPLAIVCMNYIKTINPSSIILSGRVIEHSSYLLEKVRQLVKQSMMNMPFQPSTIMVSKLGDQAGIKGAIALALQTIFEPPVTKNKSHTRIAI
jgi:predicted NBD/HSP70 family sugar kinase/biotin operon repressor